MGRLAEGRAGLSEQRKYRTFTAQKKLEIVLAGLRGDRSVREVCREHAISEALFYGWRDQLLEADGSGSPAGGAPGRERAATEGARAGAGAGPQDLRARDRGGSIARLGVRERVARSRELVARGFAAAAVARVLQITRQAI
jgi:transposase-like protein